MPKIDLKRLPNADIMNREQDSLFAKLLNLFIWKPKIEPSYKNEFVKNQLKPNKMLWDSLEKGTYHRAKS